MPKNQSSAFLPFGGPQSSDKKGFTLIELLVVITIIGILSVIGMASYRGIQNSAQDAKRKADIDAITKVYETKYDGVSGAYVVTMGEDGLPDLAESFTSGQVPTPPEGGTYTFTNCTASATSSKIKSFRICTELGSNIGQCNFQTPEADKCYCRTSSLGKYKPENFSSSCTTKLLASDGSMVTTGPGGSSGSGATGGTGSSGGKPLDIENFGDMNLDRSITLADAIIIQEYINGRRTLTDDQKFLADVSNTDIDNQGQTVDMQDYNEIIKYLNGTNPHFSIDKAQSTPCSTGIGDITGDGRVTFLDGRELSRIIDNEYGTSLYTGDPYTDAQKIRADVDFSSDVNIPEGQYNFTDRDTTAMQDHLIGFTTWFNACPSTPPTNCNASGDIQPDQEVTYKGDLRILSRFSSGLQNPADYGQCSRADLDGNGSINTSDQLLLQQYLDHARTTFPVCSTPNTGTCNRMSPP